MKIILCALLTALTMAFSSCGITIEIPDEPGVMLIDSYRSVGGTEEESGWHELVLSTGEDGSTLILDEYRSEGDGAGESRATYAVPEDVALRCYEFIEKAGFRSWNRRNDLISIDGLMLVCRFYNNGSYIRVSSDEMPEDWQKDLEGIRDILEAYACEAYLMPDDGSSEAQ